MKGHRLSEILDKLSILLWFLLYTKEFKNKPTPSICLLIGAFEKRQLDDEETEFPGWTFSNACLKLVERFEVKVQVRALSSRIS